MLRERDAQRFLLAEEAYQFVGDDLVGEDVVVEEVEGADEDLEAVGRHDVDDAGFVADGVVEGEEAVHEQVGVGFAETLGPERGQGRGEGEAVQASDGGE